MRLEPTPKAVVVTDGSARLLRFFGPSAAAPTRDVPLLLVPSLINRWYVLDLHEKASLASALAAAGFDTYCLDWGEPGDEDRFRTWDETVERLARMVRQVRRRTGASQVGLLGYCIGGTLSAIYTALEPQSVAGLVNLAGPIDFTHSGMLGTMVDPRWFDADAIAAAGNIGAMQMQAGFVALRPTGQLGKHIAFANAFGDDEKYAAAQALETWASDNIAFPAAAYTRYISELYQQNRLIAGTHAIRDRVVDLSAIDCPLLVVTTTKDTICPPKAALALTEAVGSDEVETLSIPGGHVGAVVGRKAPELLYPKIAEWFGKLKRARAAA